MGRNRFPRPASDRNTYKDPAPVKYVTAFSVDTKPGAGSAHPRRFTITQCPACGEEPTYFLPVCPFCGQHLIYKTEE